MLIIDYGYLNYKMIDTLQCIKKHKEIKNKLKEYKKFIEKNFEYLGNNFAYEARSVHYNNKINKKRKGIYGKATIKEVKELEI